MSKPPPPPPLQLATPTASSTHPDATPSAPSTLTSTTAAAASSHPREPHPGMNGSHHHSSGNNSTASNGGSAASSNPPLSSSASSSSSAGSSSSSSSSSSAAAPAAPAAAYPALHLTPLNGTFVPKQISLDQSAAGAAPGGRVKIGRQINAKTVPNATNGYFDSKVLSRAHAEVWSEDGKVFIKDVKSSNGTFINGERLSPESTESDVFELHTDDIVEFGIDILTDDTKQIVHHKVAAKVHLVLNAEDAIASHREINNWYRSAGEQSLNRSRAGPPPRTSGGLPSSQSGLSFEHVLSRLQGELQKSRDTGVNLTDVNSTLTVVHETFSGGPAPSLPPGAGIPRAFSNPRNGQQQQQSQQSQQQQQQQQQAAAAAAAAMAANEAHAQSIAALQAQLNETQASLQGHVGKIRELENLLAEHDTIKREVGSLRSQIESAQESMSALIRERQQPPGSGSRSSVAAVAAGAAVAGVTAVTNGRESPLARMLEAAEEDEDEDEDGAEAHVHGHKGIAAVHDDDDDTRSIVSVETVVAGDRRREDGRQRGPSPFDDDDAPTSTPPPSSTPAILHDDEDDGSGAQEHGARSSAVALSHRERLLEEQNGKLVARLEALSLELSEATQLGATLRTRHAEASETIKLLEQRVAALEEAVDRRVAEAEGEILAKAEQSWTGWRERFEHSWREERRTWEGERDALARLVREWEERKRLEAAAAAAAAAAEEEEAAAATSVAAARREGAQETDVGDDEGSSSSSGSDDADGVDARASTSMSLSSPGSGTSPSRTSTTKKSRSSRRRKRSSLTPVPPSVSGPAASARLSDLARHVVDAGSASGVGRAGAGVASDSDSTIGKQLGGRGERGGSPSGRAGLGTGGEGGGGGTAAAPSPSTGQDVTRGGAGGKSGEHGGLPLSVAGAVVVLAVAVGYGAAMKLKE